MEEILTLLKSNFESLEKDFYIMQNKKYRNAVLWHVPSLSVYALDYLTTELFISLIKVNSKNEIENWFNQNKSRVLDLKEEIEFMLNYKQDIEEDSLGIFRLCLLVSQQCNLNCVYCYANGGTYGKPSFMNSETSYKAIEMFSRMYNSIYDIQFLGGEPLLNLDVIEETIDFIDDLVIQGKLIKKPQISIESGLAVSHEQMKRFLNLLEEHPDICVVVSCDGPKEIQDMLRKYKDGSPSFDIVSKNLDLLREYNQPKSVQVTYTRVHQSKEMSPSDIRSYFKERFKISNIMMSDVMSRDSSIIVDKADKDYLQSRYSIEEILKRHPTSSFCRMGASSFTVDTQGHIYPCQILMGIDKFELGNVHDEIEKRKEKFLELSKFYANRADKSKYK